MTKKKPKKKPAKKKPLTEVRWACVYVGVDGKEYFGGMLAYTRRGLKGIPADRFARVRVTEIGEQ